MSWSEERRQEVVDLLTRAGVNHDTASHFDDDEMATALVVCDEVCSNTKAPDSTWFRDLYLYTGDHMVLTDEGWCPADAFDFSEGEILYEVNAPEKVTK